MNDKVCEWLKSLKYLPKFMRDFHDGKDLFKAIHSLYSDSESLKQSDVSWVSGQIYVIDVFLWYMAKHGYTLQKTRTKLDFKDIESSVSESRNKRNNAFTQMLKKESIKLE